MNEAAVVADKIKLFSANRWTLRHAGFVRIDENLGYCFTLWEVTLDTERNLVADAKGRIVGVSKKGRKFDFYFHLQLAITSCGQINSLSKTLQSVRMSLVEGKHMGDVVIECLEKDRSDAHFKLFWLKVEIKRNQNGKIE